MVLGSPREAMAQVIESTSVGRVAEHVVTSREVQIYRLLDEALRASSPADLRRLRGLELIPLDSPTFVQEVGRALLERAIYLESQAFDIGRVKVVDIPGSLELVTQRLTGSQTWSGLQASQEELRELLEVKLKATEFVRFRTDSSLVLITDAEAKAYFEAHRHRFGDLPFSDFKENIKRALGAQHMERRLADWFEVLKTKYEVQNYLVGL